LARAIRHYCTVAKSPRTIKRGRPVERRSFVALRCFAGPGRRGKTANGMVRRGQSGLAGPAELWDSPPGIWN
jgi:hypothetical protein